MNRVEFAHLISYPENELIPGIVVFFDEIMWLYNIAGNLDTQSISINNTDQSTRFDIQFLSEYQMGKLESIISQSNNMATIYGRNFIINSNRINDRSISVIPCA